MINEGDLDNALSEFNMVIKHHPELSYAYYYIGDIYTQQNLPNEALDYYLKAIKHGIPDITAYKEVVELYISMNKKKKAVEIVEQYKKLKPDDFIGTYLLNSALKKGLKDKKINQNKKKETNKKKAGSQI